jgi:DNA-binding transcriptional regulator YiaG
MKGEKGMRDRTPPPGAFKDAALRRSNRRVLADRRATIAREAERELAQQMGADEARAILRRMGWTQWQAADRLGISRRQMERWLSRSGKMSRSASALLRTLARDIPDGPT